MDLIKHEAMVGYYGRIYAGSKTIATRHGERIIPVFAFSKGGDEHVFRNLLDCVQPAMRADTLHNEYAGRYRVLEWLNDKERFDRDDPKSDPPESDMLEELNRYVYANIFGYDPDDPWIGLSNLDSLTALPKDRGLIRETRARE